MEWMRRRKTASTLVATAVTLMVAPCRAHEAHDRLRLVFSDPYSVVFMAADGAAAHAPGGVVEVTHWTFFDQGDPLTSSWGWNTRVSLAQIDCEARQIRALRHRTYLNGDFVEESPASVQMRAPRGADQAAVLAYACDQTVQAADFQVDSVAMGRIWADRAYLEMRRRRP